MESMNEPAWEKAASVRHRNVPAKQTRKPRTPRRIAAVQVIKACGEEYNRVISANWEFQSLTLLRDIPAAWDIENG